MFAESHGISAAWKEAVMNIEVPPAPAQMVSLIPWTRPLKVLDCSEGKFIHRAPATGPGLC